MPGPALHHMIVDRLKANIQANKGLGDLDPPDYAGLQEGWSAEQIAGRLRVEPAAPHRLCHETICQYVHSAEGQSAQLAPLLPERRRKRKPRHARTPRNRVFPAETSIHNRPPEINDRRPFGNWE